MHLLAWPQIVMVAFFILVKHAIESPIQTIDED